MTGINMQELADALKTNREIEFSYAGSDYIIQPETRPDSDYLVIWTVSESPSCIAEVRIGNGPADDNSVQELLTQPCFSGLSFFDISNDVSISIIF